MSLQNSFPPQHPHSSTQGPSPALILKSIGGWEPSKRQFKRREARSKGCGESFLPPLILQSFFPFYTRHLWGGRLKSQKMPKHPQTLSTDPSSAAQLPVWKALQPARQETSPIHFTAKLQVWSQKIILFPHMSEDPLRVAEQYIIWIIKSLL